MRKFLANTSLRKAFILTAISISLIAAGTLLFVVKLRRDINAQVHIYLSEVARQGANTIREIVNADSVWVKTSADILGKYANFENIYPILSFLEEERVQKGYKKMGIITRDGHLFLSSGLTSEMLAPFSKLSADQERQSRDFANKALTEQIPLSQKMYDREDGSPILAQSSPIYKNGESAGALFASRDLEDYEKLLTVDFFNGEGYSYLLNSDGDILLRANARKSVLKENDNIFDIAAAGTVKYLDGKSPENLRSDMQRGLSGSLSFKINGVSKYMHYVPVGINNWYMFSIVDKASTDKEINRLIFFAFAVSLLITLTFITIGLFVILSSKKYEEKIYNTSFIDPLTNSYNIYKFKSDGQALLQANPDKNFALIIFDINNFKIINTLYGNRQGDLVLRHLHNVLAENLAANILFARDSADMFALLMPYTKDEDIINFINKLDPAFKNCYATTDKHYAMSLSYGIYKITDRSVPFYTTYDRANMARIEAKKSPSEKYFFYDPAMEENLLQTQFVENNIQKALDNHEMEVYFQPIYNLKTGELFAAEALARWIHPTKGTIAPEDFLPVLEKTGSIVSFDRYILQNTANILHGWIDKKLSVVPIAVNHSGLHFTNPDFPYEFKEIFDKAGVPTQYIEVELTESTIVENIKLIPTFADKMRELGFATSMDDFGTGSSSLNILKNLHIDIIKLDKEFLTDLSSNPRSREIIKASVDLIKKLNIKVVAEGVETKEQAAFLKSIGCDYAQGFLYYEAISPGDFEKLISEQPSAQ